MALFEYQCLKCNFQFEQIVFAQDSQSKECPKCGSEKTQKLISKFAIGGQGDLRESADYHGCHPSVDHHDSDDPGSHDH